jgi:hypothetical protein
VNGAARRNATTSIFAKIDREQTSLLSTPHPSLPLKDFSAKED